MASCVLPMPVSALNPMNRLSSVKASLSDCRCLRYGLCNQLEVGAWLETDRLTGRGGGVGVCPVSDAKQILSTLGPYPLRR